MIYFYWIVTCSLSNFYGQPEDKMKLAYIIIAHHQFPLLERLVHRLNQPGVSFIFHISKNCEEGFFDQVQSAFGNAPNMRFARRVNIYWGDFNIVRAVINGIETLVESGFEYEYAISLSGQDYPIVSHETICQTLAAGEGKQFMEFKNMDTMEHDDFHRYQSTHVWIKNHHFWYPHTNHDAWHIRLYNRVLGLFLPECRILPNGYTGYKGSFWWQLTPDCIDYIDNYLNTPPGKRLVRYYTFTYHAAEFFFQTMLLNSPLRDQIINEDHHFSIWYEETGHPKTFVAEDYEAIMSSGKLFGRKFILEDSKRLLDRIDQTVNPRGK